MEVGRSSCLFALCSRSNAQCFLPDGCWFWYGHSHPGRKLMCGMGSCLAWGVFIFKFILGYEFITLSINSQFPMHPSLSYHLLRLKNHMFVLSGNFTSQGLDQIGISNQRGRGGEPPPLFSEMMGLIPPVSVKSRTSLFYKYILRTWIAHSMHSSTALLGGCFWWI